jgi:cbb3-type cytochrome oxidase maturation protein
MDSLYLLIPIALVFAAIVIALLFWSINSGQYEDLDNEASRILFDDDNIESRKDKQS